MLDQTPPPMIEDTRPARKTPWWRGRLVIGSLALVTGLAIGASGAGGPEATASANEPKAAPTVTVTAEPKSAGGSTKDLDAQRAELDDRAAELADKEAELAEREGALDDREATVAEGEATLEQATDEAAANTISGDGIYVVGEEIEAGTYRSDGDGEFCYWARLSGLSGELDEVLANHAGSAKTTVEIQSGDVAFETSDCGDWTKVS